jgi:hypothetical protein
MIDFHSLARAESLPRGRLTAEANPKPPCESLKPAPQQIDPPARQPVLESRVPPHHLSGLASSRLWLAPPTSSPYGLEPRPCGHARMGLSYPSSSLLGVISLRSGAGILTCPIPSLTRHRHARYDIRQAERPSAITFAPRCPCFSGSGSKLRLAPARQLSAQGQRLDTAFRSLATTVRCRTTITRSMFPACIFGFSPIRLRNPVYPRLLRSTLLR